MHKAIGVLGLGIFGSSIAKELGEHNHDVIAVDLDQENIDRIEPYLVKGVVGDFTDFDLLKHIGIDQCDRVVVASGSSLEASVLAIMNLKKLGVKDIIAKSKNRSYMEIMLEIGASSVIRPEHEMGVRTARHIVSKHILDVIDLDGNSSVIEIKPPESWVGKTLSELDLRQKYEINVIGIKQDEDSKIDYFLTTDTQIEKDSIIVVIGNSDNLESLDYFQELT